MKFSRVVVCDFDGTITTQDTFVTMIEKFAFKVSAPLLPKIFSCQITLKEDIQQTLGSISINSFSPIIEHPVNQPICPALNEFLDFLNHVKISHAIISVQWQDFFEVGDYLASR